MKLSVRVGKLKKRWKKLPKVKVDRIGAYTYYRVDHWSFEAGDTEDDYWDAVIANLAMINYLRGRK